MIDSLSAAEYRSLVGATDGPAEMSAEAFRQMRGNPMSASDLVPRASTKGVTCTGCGRAKTACECLELALLHQIVLIGLPMPEREYRFCGRLWRFDFAYPDRLIAIECEGGTWLTGAHSRGKHYESDCEKYSEAAIAGWRLLRFTTDMIHDGRAVALVERALA